ncbi:MAG TPA: aldolase/citrate lyase family protein [Hydrogenophilus thermoluteolus]|nr:aldolase/citrate lyase family protein [Hydrogenophilus thermoluteolus]HNU19137.1 aldolase/citrate lyase family protein [Hydrogenophilus thermoluteolus]
MTPYTNPVTILFGATRRPQPIPPVVHYCGQPRFMEKALALQAQEGPRFDITFDLEDGAPAGDEAAHAARAVEYVMSETNRFGRVGVRIHDRTHPHWWRDLTTLLPVTAERIAFVTLPKARAYEDVAVVADAIAFLCRNAARTPPLHVLIETHGALRDAYRIAAHPLVECLDFGLMDFVSEHLGAIPADAMRTPLQFEHPLIRRAKTTVAAAAHAAGKVPAHNVCVALDDPNLAYQDARRARDEFGFTRMWSIHPSQIGPIVDAFTPDAEAIRDAERILLAAAAADWGPIRDRGRLHDRASYRYYWMVLARAHQVGVPLPETIAAWFVPESKR